RIWTAPNSSSPAPPGKECRRRIPPRSSRRPPRRSPRPGALRETAGGASASADPSSRRWDSRGSFHPFGGHRIGDQLESIALVRAEEQAVVRQVLPQEKRNPPQIVGAVVEADGDDRARPRD